MSVNDLSRAVALKALAADVAARLQLGEHPHAIRAALLAEGYPPELVDHVFAVCEIPQRTGRKRTVLAAALSAVLLIGLPLVGAIGGAWVAVTIEKSAREPEPEPDLDAAEHEMRGGNPAVGKHFADSVTTLIVGAVGLVIGGALGVGLAFPLVRSLSEWSIDSSTTDDEMLE